MSPLAWLAIPGVALVLAVAWVAWTGRERPRADTHDTVLAHERFKAAFERPLTTTSRPSRDGARPLSTYAAREPVARDDAADRPDDVLS
jgi:hypothetical protein